MKKPLWSKTEEINFIRDIISGKSFIELSSKYNRSPNALELRLKKIIFDNIESKKTEEKLSQMLKIPVDKIKQYYYEYKGFLEKKGKLDTNIKLELGSEPKLELGSEPKIEFRSEPKSEPKLEEFDHKLELFPDFKQNNDYDELLNNNKDSEYFREEKLNKYKNKLKKLEKENKIMKCIIDNYELKQKMNNMIEDGLMNKRITSIIKDLIS